MGGAEGRELDHRSEREGGQSKSRKARALGTGRSKRPPLLGDPPFLPRGPMRSREARSRLAPGLWPTTALAQSRLASSRGPKAGSRSAAAAWRSCMKPAPGSKPRRAMAFATSTIWFGSRADSSLRAASRSASRRPSEATGARGPSWPRAQRTFAICWALKSGSLGPISRAGPCPPGSIRRDAPRLSASPYGPRAGSRENPGSRNLPIASSRSPCPGPEGARRLVMNLRGKEAAATEQPRLKSESRGSATTWH